MRIRSIQVRWTISIMFLAILPVLVLGALISWKSYTVQIELTNKYQREVAKRALSHVQVFIHEMEAIFQMAIKLNNLNNLSKKEQTTLLEKLLNIGDDRHVNLIEELSLVDSAGREEVRVGRMEVHVAEDLRELSNSKVFLTPVNTGNIFYGPVLINEETGEPFFSMGIPTLDLRSGEIDGVLVAKVRLHAAWKMITDIQVGESGQAYIVDPTGLVVAHKNRSLVLQGVSIGKEVKTCHIEKGFEGGYVLRACEPFNLGDQKLRLITDTSLAEVLAPTFRVIQTIFFLLLFSIAAAIFLGWIVQRNVIKPIINLAHTAEAITEGDLNKRTEIQQDDEIGSLANAFNTMTARLIETTERKRAREEAAIMEERSRLARDLHDSVTQSLYSLTLFAETGRQLVEKGDLENLRQCFSEIVSSSQVILKEMRLLMFDLRPAALEEEGLLRALQKRLDSVEQRSGVKSVLNVIGDAKISPVMEEGFYRIAQEALNNSLKYSSAKKVTVAIRFEEEKVEMEISDDGVGFDVDSILERGGMGLTNMQERAANLGGSLQISSASGKGTTIRFSVQYIPEKE